MMLMEYLGGFADLEAQFPPKYLKQNWIVNYSSAH